MIPIPQETSSQNLPNVFQKYKKNQGVVGASCTSPLKTSMHYVFGDYFGRFGGGLQVFVDECLGGLGDMFGRIGKGSGRCLRTCLWGFGESILGNCWEALGGKQNVQCVIEHI